MRRAILAALLLWPAMAGAQDGPDADGWDRRGHERVKTSRVARPLTTPRRMFDVFVHATLGTPSATEQSFFRLAREERTSDARLGLATGAYFGIRDDWEVGVTLPPMLFDDGVVFSGPVLEMTWRPIALDGFELGLTGSSVLPVAERFGFEARVPMLLRLGDAARLDAIPSIAVRLGDGPDHGVAKLPVHLTVQVAPIVFVRATAGLATLGFEDLSMLGGGEVGVTIPGDYGAVADLLLGLTFPRLIEGSGRGTSLATEHWVVSLSARFFAWLPQDRSGLDDLGEL